MAVGLDRLDVQRRDTLLESLDFAAHRQFSSVDHFRIPHDAHVQVESPKVRSPSLRIQICKINRQFPAPVGGVMSHRNVVVRHLGVLGSAAALVSTRLAKDTHGKDHPEYYALIGGKRQVKWQSQLCLTNPEVFNIVVQAVRDEIKKQTGGREYLGLPERWVQRLLPMRGMCGHR